MINNRDRFMDFTVAGRGAFPADMLRYAECWPTTTEDATAMFDDTGRREIKLRTWQEINVASARWESFNWKVVNIDKAR